MNKKTIIVRYGELALKKRETRKRFENTLNKNIFSAFSSQGLDCQIETTWGRLFIYTTDIPKGVAILRRIFGITSVSPAITSSSNLMELSQDSIAYLEGKIRTNDSFALRVTRTGNHNYTSQDAARIIGELIRKNFFCSVHLNKPDIELFIEIRGQNAYIYLEKYLGPGGMPLGTQGRICTFVNSDDDVLASWFLMKRGCSIVFISMNHIVDSVLSLLISLWFAPFPIYHIDSEKQYLKQINEIVHSHHCLALCFGSSFSKEKEQLLKRICEIKDSIGIPVLTPLVSMTKEDIEQTKKHLGLKQ